MKRGISSSRNLVPFLTCLANSGINFAFRYYSRSSWKRLTLAEARALTSAGIEIGVVYEDGPTAVTYFTAARGQADAQRAIAFAQDMGQPPGTAIYFAVDYDAAPSHLSAIGAYFAAARSQLDPSGYQVGIYGGGTVCNTIKEKQGLAIFSWLAEANGWLGSRTYSTWDVKQSPGRVPLCGLAGPRSGLEAEYEDNQAQANFGGFTLEPTAAPPLAATIVLAETTLRIVPAKSARKKQPTAKPKKKTARKKTTASKKPAPKKTTGAKKLSKKSVHQKSTKTAATKKKNTKAKAVKKQQPRKRR